jgi:predicted RNA-binding Zn ribbon-like protein
MPAGASQLVKCVLMETPSRPAGIRELPIVAGQLALDFANTVDDPLGPQRYDHVADYPALLAWSVRIGTLPGDAADALVRAGEQQPRRAAQVMRRATALRDAINGTFGAVLRDRTTATGPWSQLRPFIATAVGHAGLPAPDPAWDFTDLEAPLWPVAEAAYRLLISPDLHRLKRCVGCPWLFLDQSKNGSRRWCSMEDCGTDRKKRRYVARRAARRIADRATD